MAWSISCGEAKTSSRPRCSMIQTGQPLPSVCLGIGGSNMVAFQYEASTPLCTHGVRGDIQGLSR